MSAEKDETIQVRFERRDDRTNAIAYLSNCSEATITVEGELRNVSCSRPFPFTMDSGGSDQFEVASFWVTTPGEPDTVNVRTFSQVGRRNPRVRHAQVYALPYRGGRYIIERVFPARKPGPVPRRNGDVEYAVQWRMPEGTVVCAAREGTVVAVRMDGVGGGPDPEAHGGRNNYVVLRHGDGTYGRYFHLQTDSAAVRLGGRVKVGQPLARAGSTGWTTYPILTFQVYCPIDGKTLRGFPLTFRTPDGKTIAPRPGKQYLL